MEIKQSITENLWWVIPDRLGGMRKPTIDELKDLQSVGIGGIVSVLDDRENLDIYEQFSFPYLWLPVQGGTAPNLEQVVSLRDFVNHNNSKGMGVAIHCTNGKRRTGTFLAAYLISNGKSFREALEILEQAKPNLDLREAQLGFLQTLDRGLV